MYIWEIYPEAKAIGELLVCLAFAIVTVEATRSNILVRFARFARFAR